MRLELYARVGTWLLVEFTLPEYRNYYYYPVNSCCDLFIFLFILSIKSIPIPGISYFICASSVPIYTASASPERISRES